MNLKRAVPWIATTWKSLVASLKMNGASCVTSGTSAIDVL